jgi:O-antigen ligase
MADSAAPSRALRRDAALVGTVRWALVAVAIGAFVSPPVANLAGAIALLAFVAAPSAGRRARAVWAQPIGRATVLLIAVFAASTLWSAAPWPERLSALWNWRALLLLLAGVAVFDDERARVRMALAFVVAAAIAALFVLAGRYGLLPPRPNMEPGIYLRNTVTQAMTLGVAAYLAAMLALVCRRWPARARAALAIVALLLLATLFSSGLGRSGHLTAVIVTAATAAHYLRGWRLGAAAVAVPLAALAVVAVAPGVSQRFALGWNELQTYSTRTELTSMGIRAIIWRTTADLIREKPLLGYGQGGYPAAYAARVQAQYAGWKATPTADPHNQYLALMVDSGIPGVLAFFWFLVAATRQRSPLPWRVMGISLLAAWCVTSLFSSHFQTFSEGHLIAVFAAAFLARGQDDGREAAYAASAASTAATTSS